MAKRATAWVAGLLIGLLYLYAIVTGIGNFVGLVGLGGALGTGLSVSGQLWLIVGIAMPALVGVAALVLGRGRGAGTRILMLATGLAIVAIWQIDMMHTIPESSYFG